MSRVELQHTSKSLGTTEVIHDASLSIAEGEFCVFVGPSGCGKSTLLRMIAGLKETSGGEIFIGDRNVTDEDPGDRGVAMVFKMPSCACRCASRSPSCTRCSATRRSTSRTTRPKPLTMAKRIVVLRAGKVEQIGAPLTLYDDPDNAFVAGFIGSPRMNFLAASALGGSRFAVAGTEIALPLASAVPAGTEVKFGIRPEHLEAVDGAAIEVAVDVVEQLGSTSCLYAATSRGEPIVAEQWSGHVRSGDRATLRFKAADARLFSVDGMRIR